MAALNDSQKRQVIQREPSLSAEKMLEYIQRYENLSLADFPNMDGAKRKYIQDKLNSVPNPSEQNEWKAIESMLGTASEQLLKALEDYIRNWESTRPADNHVDQANNEAERVRGLLEEQQRQVEENDWNLVDILDFYSLTAHLTKYPHTVHRNEIDENIWSLVNREDVQAIQNYLSLFPNGMHAVEARDILSAIVEWNTAKNTYDILIINNYIKAHPTSPFLQQAQLLLMSMKQHEISEMRTNPNGYEVSFLLRLINEGVFTDNELIMAKVMTGDILETLRKGDYLADLPDIKKAIAESTPECKEDYTDVYFFGVPSTGKTCVLMGLSCSSALNINLASGGGDYAAALQQFTDMGVTVPRTPGTFVATLEAEIHNDQDDTIEHHVNLVEMSGEEFAFSIANNPEHIYSFEDMGGKGAPALLQNNNRKVFFLIIDPTANIVRINREIDDGYDENTGQKLTHLEECVVNQQIVITKMVALFKDKSNSDIMDKVDSIHIVMTKSDMLGNPVEREEKAYKIFKEKYESKILKPLIKLCQEHNINSNTNFCPKLYTFSLGTFYVGGLYNYEQTDSNRLVTAIQNATSSVREKSFWEKLKEKLN